MVKNKWITPSWVILVIATITSLFVWKTMNVFGDNPITFNWWLISLYFIMTETIYIIWVATDTKEDWGPLKALSMLIAVYAQLMLVLLSAITLVVLEYIVCGCLILALFAKGNQVLAKTVRGK